MRYKKSRKRGPVTAKKISYDGINFASGLERYTYIALKKAKLFEYYEGENFALIDSFDFPNESYEKQANGKGEYINRGIKKILGINILEYKIRLLERKNYWREKYKNG